MVTFQIKVKIKFAINWSGINMKNFCWKNLFYKFDICLFSGRFENFNNAFENTTREPGAFALAFYSGLFSYAGW